MYNICYIIYLIEYMLCKNIVSTYVYMQINIYIYTAKLQTLPFPFFSRLVQVINLIYIKAIEEKLNLCLAGRTSHQ